MEYESIWINIFGKATTLKMMKIAVDLTELSYSGTGIKIPTIYRFFH